MDNYEDRRALVKVNDLPGSDLPRDIPIRDNQDRKPELTSRIYDFDKDKKAKLNYEMGGVI